MAGLAATSPVVDGQVAQEEQGRPCARTSEHTARGLQQDQRGRHEAAVPEHQDQRATFTTVYGGVAATVPANAVADLLKVDGVAAVQKDTPRAAADRRRRPSSPAPPTSGRRSAARSMPPRTSSSACSTPASGPSIRRSRTTASRPPPGGPYGCQFGDGSDVAHLGPRSPCNRKLVGAYAFTRHLPRRARRGAGRVLQQRDQASARRATPNGHGTHTASTAAGGPRRQRADLRRSARADQRHGAGRARDHVPRLPRAGLLQLRLGRGDRSRRSRTTST